MSDSFRDKLIEERRGQRHGSASNDYVQKLQQERAEKMDISPELLEQFFGMAASAPPPPSVQELDAKAKEPKIRFKIEVGAIRGMIRGTDFTVSEGQPEHMKKMGGLLNDFGIAPDAYMALVTNPGTPALSDYLGAHANGIIDEPDERRPQEDYLKKQAAQQIAANLKTTNDDAIGENKAQEFVHRLTGIVDTLAIQLGVSGNSPD